MAPKSILLGYQRRWVDDHARFKIGLWARQTGKSFSCQAEAVEDSLLRKTDWVVLSAGERQALEAIEKAKQWAEAYRFAIEHYAEDRESAQALIKAAEIRWSNGSRLIALPANPNTARGYSANLILDEFAFHEDPDKIWRAIYPSISNPLSGEKMLRIVSTPNGKANKFYDLWTKNPSYSHHKITIHDAVAGGLPVNIDELRAGLDDPEGWAQEYECEFIDSYAVLLPYEVIAAVEHAEATEWIAADFFTGQRESPLFLGIDFGRKRDLSVCYTLKLVGDVLWTAEVFTMSKMASPEQLDLLRPRIRAARRVCFDYTGPGVGLGDWLVKEFGQYDPDSHRFGKIELCQFTNSLLVDVFPKLRMRFDERRIRIPVSRELREDLHSIHRVTTPGGRVTYRAPHSDDGHSDRAYALALAVRAAAAPRGLSLPPHAVTRGGDRSAARLERSVLA